MLSKQNIFDELRHFSAYRATLTAHALLLGITHVFI